MACGCKSNLKMWIIVFLVFISSQNPDPVTACNDAPGLSFCIDGNFTGQAVYFDARGVGENAMINCTCTLQIKRFSRFIKLKYYGPGFVGCGYRFVDAEGVRIFGCSSTETVYYSSPFTTIQLHKYKTADNSGACVGILLDHQYEPNPNDPIIDPELTATCYSSDTKEAPLSTTILTTTPTMSTTTVTSRKETTATPKITTATPTKLTTTVTPKRPTTITTTQKLTTTTTTTPKRTTITTLPLTTTTATTTTPTQTITTKSAVTSQSTQFKDYSSDSEPTSVKPPPEPTSKETLVLVLATTTAVGWTLLVILVVIVVVLCWKRRFVCQSTKHGKLPDVKAPENIDPGGQSLSADPVRPVQDDYTTLKLGDGNENGYTNISRDDDIRSPPQRNDTYLKPKEGAAGDSLELSTIALTDIGSQKHGTYLKPIQKQTDMHLNVTNSRPNLHYEVCNEPTTKLRNNKLWISKQSRNAEGEQDNHECHVYETMK